MSIFSCQNLSIQVGEKSKPKVLVKGLTFNLQAGEILCVLGQNGSGKSSLLHVMSGINASDAGSIEINSKLLRHYKRKDLAKELGLVTQTHEDPFPITVFDFTLAGRHPYLGLLAWETAADKAITEKSLQKVQLLTKRNQLVQTLSGGERKRLSIARLLCQDPNIMLWDEPTNHLDPAQQKQVLQLIKTLQQKGKAQILALHDINHAARIATHILFLYENETWQMGSKNEMLHNHKLEQLYQTEFKQVSIDSQSVFSLG